MSNSDRARRGAANIEHWMGQVYPAIAARVQGAVAGYAIEQWVQDAPVVSGHYKKNCQVSFFGPRVAELPGGDKAGTETILREKTKLVNAGFAQRIFLTNPVPYAIPVETRHATLAGVLSKVMARARILAEAAARDEVRSHR